MSRIEEIKAILSVSDQEIQYIDEEFKNVFGSNVPWFMRVFTFFGALLAALLFLLFVGIAGFFNEMSAVGFIGVLILTVCTILTHVIKDNAYLEPFIIVGLILGQVLLTISLMDFIGKETLITLGIIGIILELALFVACRSITQRFLSVILFFLSIMCIIYESNQFSIISIVIGFIVFAFTQIHFNRGFFLYLEKKWSSIFNPLKFGLLFSSVTLSSLSVFNDNLEMDNQYWWLATTIITMVLGWFLVKISKEKKWPKNLINTIVGSLVILVIPTINAPGIILSILICILGFRFSSISTLIIGIISMLFFISAFYYTLQLTLLVKSIILMVSGIFFLGAFMAINRFWPKVELK